MNPGAHRGLCAIAFAVVVWTAVAAGAGDRPSIGDLAARERPDGIVVSWRVLDAVDEELRERIASGIAVGLRHRVEVVSRKAWWLSPSRELARGWVETRVEYDSLTARYSLTRTTRVRGRGREADEISRTDNESTESIDRALDWLTGVRDLVLPIDRDRGGDPARVRLEVVLGRRFVLWIFPASKSIESETPIEREP